MNEKSRTVAWGRADGIIHAGRLPEIELIGDIHQAVHSLAMYRTWPEAAEALGYSNIDRYFGFVLDGWWEDFCMNDDRPVVSRPEGWVPNGEIAVLEWVSDLPVLDSRDALGLPDEFFAFGTGGGNMLRGEYWYWSESDLPALAALSDHLRYEFIERQDLIDRARDGLE